MSVCVPSCQRTSRPGQGPCRGNLHRHGWPFLRVVCEVLVVGLVWVGLVVVVVVVVVAGEGRMRSCVLLLSQTKKVKYDVILGGAAAAAYLQVLIFLSL
jgi:hypothetical protein